MSIVKKRVTGIFTPWAQVLCYACHGNDLLGFRLPAERFTEVCTPRDEVLDELEGPGTCDECFCDVWVRGDVAQLQGVRALAGGSLQQTGGMCAMLQIDVGLNRICINADDMLYVSLYPTELAIYEGDHLLSEVFTLGAYDLVVKAIELMKEHCL